MEIINVGVTYQVPNVDKNRMMGKFTGNSYI
jgi:hypothetical protein